MSEITRSATNMADLEGLFFSLQSSRDSSRRWRLRGDHFNSYVSQASLIREHASCTLVHAAAMAAPPAFTVPAGEQSLGRGRPPELLKVFPEEAEVLRFVPQDVGHFSIRLLLPVCCSLLGGTVGGGDPATPTDQSS